MHLASVFLEQTVNPEGLAKIKDFFSSIDITDARDMMNPSVWSSQSIEGIIVMVLIIFVIYKLFHRAYRFVWWCVGLIIFIQCMYILGISPVNNYIPLHSIFPYDILSSIAQLFVGTKAGDILLWVNELLNKSVGVAGMAFLNFGKAIIRILSSSNPLTCSIIRNR